MVLVRSLTDYIPLWTANLAKEKNRSEEPIKIRELHNVTYTARLNNKKT